MCLQLIKEAFNESTPSEVLSRTADEIRLRVRTEDRKPLIAAFIAEIERGYPAVPHMPEETKRAELTPVA